MSGRAGIVPLSSASSVGGKLKRQEKATLNNSRKSMQIIELLKQL